MVSGRQTWVPAVGNFIIWLGLFKILSMVFETIKDRDIITSFSKHNALLGMSTGIILTIYLFYISFVNLRDFEEFMSIILPNTPKFLFGAILIGIVVYSLYLGIEVLARFAFFLLPINLVIILLGVVGSSHKVSAGNILPFYEYEPSSVIWGSAMQFTNIGQVLAILPFIPLLSKNSNKTYGMILWPLVVEVMLVIIIYLFVIGVFGVDTYIVNYKLYMLFRESFDMRYEITFVFLWVSTFIIKSAVLLAGLSLLAGRILNLRRKEIFFFPLGVLTVVLSLSSFEAFTDYFIYYSGAHVLFSGALIVILMVLLTAALFINPGVVVKQDEGGK